MYVVVDSLFVLAPNVFVFIFVFGPSFVVQSLVSFIVVQSFVGEERDGFLKLL